MRIHREPAAYSENRLGDRLGCAGAACLSARNYLLSFFLSGFSPPRFATRSATVVLLFCCHPPPLLSTLPRGPRGLRHRHVRSPAPFILFSLCRPLALRRPRMQQLREHASCSTGNEPGPLPSTEKGISRYRRTRNAERSIARHRTFRRELIRLFGAVASAQSGTKIRMDNN